MVAKLLKAKHHPTGKILEAIRVSFGKVYTRLQGYYMQALGGR